jgi:predicted dehydrogenase
VSEPLNVLVVGAGMFVSGIGTPGFGTVIPTLADLSTKGVVGRGTIAATNPANGDVVLGKAAAFQRLIGSNLALEYLPRGDARDGEAYLRAADDERFDCAIVSVPDDLHFPVAKALLERGLHVLVVKPFVPTLAEADELIALARSRNLYGAVEFHKRFDEANLRTKRMLREGAIGDVLYALVEFSQRRSVPLEHFAAWSARSNIFQYLGVHYVDMVWFCTGARPHRVAATGQKNLLLSRGLNTYDAVQANIEWISSAGKPFVTTILTNWVDSLGSSAISDQKIRWIGTAGRIDSEQKDRGLQLTSDAGVQHVNPYFSDLLYDADDRPQFGGYGYRSVAQFLHDVSAIKAGRAEPSSLRGSRSTFEDARVSTSVIEAVNLSLQSNGAWIDIPS